MHFLKYGEEVQHTLFLFTLFFCFAEALHAKPIDLTNVDIKAMGRVRGEMSNNADFLDSANDENNFIGSRFRLSIDLKPNEKTNIVTEFQHSKSWGLPSGTLQDEPSSIHQAYIKHKIVDSFEVKIGRQEIAYGDELIIGAVGWSNFGRSFDAFKGRLNYGLGWTDIFIADVTRNLGGTSTNDHFFSGLYSHLSLENIDELELYILHTQDPNANTNEVFHYGSRIKSQHDSLNYRAEVTMQSEVRASQWDLEVGYTINRTQLAVEFFSASKDYIQLFPTAHKWLGIADFISRRNVSGGRAGVSHNFTDKFKAKFDYHMFQRTDSAQPYYAFNGNAVTTNGDETHIGDEVNLELFYQLDPTFSVRIGGAHFFIGSHLEENNRTSDGNFYYLQTMAKF